MSTVCLIVVVVVALFMFVVVVEVPRWRVGNFLLKSNELTSLFLQ